MGAEAVDVLDVSRGLLVAVIDMAVRFDALGLKAQKATLRLIACMDLRLGDIYVIEYAIP